VQGHMRGRGHADVIGKRPSNFCVWRVPGLGRGGPRVGWNSKCGGSCSRGYSGHRTGRLCRSHQPPVQQRAGVVGCAPCGFHRWSCGCTWDGDIDKRDGDG